MQRTALAGALAALLVPNLVLAEMSYSNVEVNYVDVELDGPGNVDGDGLEIAGSFEINSRVFVFGEWQDQNLDFGIDGREIEIGGGIRHSFSDKVDFFGSLSFVDAKVDTTFGSADDDGLAIGGGVRGKLSNQIELDAGIKYIDFDSGGDTGFSFGARYYFNPSMALGANAEFADNADTLRLGFRWEF